VKPRWRRWARRVLVWAAMVALVVAAIYESGLAERWIRDALISRLEQASGARVDMGGFHFDLWSLRVEIDNLTLHGLEAANQAPLFHADRVDVGIRVMSFFGRKIALDELIVDRPQVAIRLDRDGHSNLPALKSRASSRPWRATLFDLRIARLELRNGGIAYNDVRAPLAVQGRDFNFTLHYDSPPNGADSYVGDLDWKQVKLAARHDVPFPFDLSAKFTLHRDSFELNEIALKALHSSLNLQAELPSFARPDWDFKYRGRLSLADIRNVMRQPTTPDGDADFSGQAHYRSGAARNGAATGGEWTASGYYSSTDVALPYRFYHEKGIETSGDFKVANRRLVVPNLSVHALGGAIDGQLEMDFKGLAFRTKTRLRGASLAQLFDTLDNDELPVRSLHWDGVVDLDSVNTWNANFKNFRTTGQMRWSPPNSLRAGMIPATARLDYDYRTDQQVVSVSQSEITTPSARVAMDGTLGEKDSALEVSFSTENLLVWDDFISAIRGPDAGTHRVAGKAAWRGRVIGPLIDAAFVGHLSVTNPQYDNLAWDQLEGDMEYSPDGFILKNAAIRRGGASSALNLSLQFGGDWNFLPSSAWTLEARIERASGDDLQTVLGTSYPLKVELSGDVHGGGTRGAPVIDAGFVAENIEVRGWQADRLSGELHWEQDLVKLSHAELREKFGTVAGDLAYRPQEQQAEFAITGRAISLDRIKRLQTPSLPIGGRLDFNLRGSGPLRAPTAQGSLKVTNLVLGAEPEGDFAAQCASDGKSAHFTLASEPAREKLQGDLTIGLTGDEPISGKLSVQQFDLDPLIVAGLHLSQLTGHGSADATFTISGSLRQPDSIEVDADIARISFSYEFVQLTNDQNIRLAYRRNEIRIEQARLHGPDTDLQVSGSARFDRDRRLDFTFSGGANLRLVAGLLPDLNARGRAEVNVSVQGTMAQPRVTGHVTVRDAAATYADFPVGLSKVNGDFVFDKSRLLFDRVTAEAGGGQLTLTGAVTYGEGPLRYQVTATTSTVRIRYPVGMSWLAGGTLQLSGTSDAALVSGRVQVERLLFAQGVDVASFFAGASEISAGTTSTSPFLQNLAFDVEGRTAPGAHIEWTGAHVEVDGNVRLRGTWDRPVLLGNIHLLSGEMPFRGNTFELTRGDINFSNPFRLDPVLNVEATSTINQYQVTIEFSGPASHLSLNYRSDPPLPDSDIVALLALGSPGEGAALRSQPGAAQNYGATALLSEAISSGVGGRIEHLFGITSFRVDPFVAGTATESNAAARVTIQKQVSRDLSFTYSTNAATSNQYQLIQVEYTLRRNLSVQFLRDINGTYGFDIKFVKHFK
jgi:translocation and assembly module TamB